MQTILREVIQSKEDKHRQVDQLIQDEAIDRYDNDGYDREAKAYQDLLSKAKSGEWGAKAVVYGMHNMKQVDSVRYKYMHEM